MNLREDELKFMIENGKIENDTIQMLFDMTTKNMYLEMHESKIWQSEKDHYWRTYLPDEEKGRRLVKKSSLESLEKEVISYYRKHHTLDVEKSIKSNITLYQLFPEWLDVKRLHTNSTANINRICATWKRFYEVDKELIDVPMKSLTKVYLDNWVHKRIQENHMTRQDYFRMSLILRQCMEYAFEQGYISENVFAKVKVNTKMLVHKTKGPDEEQVFTEEETQMLIDEMYRRFNDKPDITAPLGIILNFELGLRIGELVAIKESDIENGYIHIQRQEVREYGKVNDYKMKVIGYGVGDYTKTPDGDREIPLTQNAMKLIDTILRTNKEYGHECEGFLFVYKDKRMNHYWMERRLNNGCEAIGIPKRAMHKIRKTVISTLIDERININAIRKIAGHADERTTYNCYCFNRKDRDETKKQFERALSRGKVIKGNHNIIEFPIKKETAKSLI